MATNFIPRNWGLYYFATRQNVYSNIWDGHSPDIRNARGRGVFPYTPDGKKLAELQHAFLALPTETSMFWEWVDDYELHT